MQPKGDPPIHRGTLGNFGETRGGVGKMAFWRTKAAISLKRKMEEKLLLRAYRKSPKLFRTVPSPTPYGLPFLEIGGLQLSYPLLSQEQLKLRTSNLAGTCTGPIRVKVHKNLGENGAWAYPGTAQIFGVPPIISGTGKATDFKFCKNIHGVDRNKSPWKMLGTVAMGVVRESRKFSGHPCMGRGHLCDSTAFLLPLFVSLFVSFGHL